MKKLLLLMISTICIMQLAGREQKIISLPAQERAARQAAFLKEKALKIAKRKKMQDEAAHEKALILAQKIAQRKREQKELQNRKRFIWLNVNVHKKQMYAQKSR